MPDVGEDQEAAIASVQAIFKALPKTRQAEYIGELNEVLLYIEKHSSKK